MLIHVIHHKGAPIDGRAMVHPVDRKRPSSTPTPVWSGSGCPSAAVIVQNQVFVASAIEGEENEYPASGLSISLVAQKVYRSQ